MPIPLCVPFEARGRAYAAGARWNGTEKVWECDPALLAAAGGAYDALRPFLPRMHRRDLEPPYVRPFMVPQSCWGKNLRAVLSEEDWKRVRQHAYDAAGRRCVVCGGRGPQWPVEADEAWAYDDAARVQTLKGVIALCPDCHLVRHWGRATVTGIADVALAQMMRVNGWSREQAEAAGDEGMRLWESRSRQAWRIDYSWVTRVHGIGIDAGGLGRAEAANEQIVREAEADRGRGPADGGRAPTSLERSLG